MNGDEQEGPAAPARTWPGYVLGAYALICGASAVLSARMYPHGWAVITVPALGCVGVMAGVMLLLRDGWWKPLLQLWLLAQAAVVIVDTSGPLTRQPGLHINYIRFGAVTSSGPLLLDYTGWGINFAAVILLVLVWVVLAKRWYPACAGPWLKPSLDFTGWNTAQGTAILHQALVNFKAMLTGLASSPANLFSLIDTQGVLDSSDWANELHPHPGGFKKLAAKILEALHVRFPGRI